MSGIGIIVNRNARKSRAFRGPAGLQLGYVLGDPGSCRETSCVAEIDDVARAFRDRDIDLLAIGGGDGSNHHVLSTFIRVYGDHPLPRVAFLRGGTHNACATSLGLRGRPEEILQRLLVRYHAGERLATVTRPMLRIDHGSGVHHGFTFCTGFLFRFFQQMQAQQSDTPARVAKLIASLFLSFFLRSRKLKSMFDLEPARILLSGSELPWPLYNGVAAATMECVGVGIRPFTRVRESTDAFHALAFRITPSRFVRVSVALLRGRLQDHPQHLSTMTDSLEVQAPHPIPYALDGELFLAGPRLRVGVGPRLRLVVC